MKTKNKQEKKKRNKLIIILAIVLALLLAVNIYLYFQTKDIIETRELEASVIVANISGFDLNNTSLTFGQVSPGRSMMRMISLENNYDFPIEVYIFGKGEMKNFVFLSKQIIGQGEQKEIGVSAQVANNTAYGEYKGKVIFQFRKIS
jgi:hypothetical protein